jgi:hypothetical protein
MKTLILISSLFYFVHCDAQREDRTISDLVATIDLLDYTPVKRFKFLNQIEFKKFLYGEIESNVLTQLNIDGRYLCENERRKGFEVYNLYYEKISWEFYSNKCKEINMLLAIDGVIVLPK